MTLFVTRRPDDSSLFVAAWYGLATVIMVMRRYRRRAILALVRRRLAGTGRTKCGFSGRMVGATGIEPVTPTMST